MITAIRLVNMSISVSIWVYICEVHLRFTPLAIFKDIIHGFLLLFKQQILGFKLLRTESDRICFFWSNKLSPVSSPTLGDEENYTCCIGKENTSL